jgi:type II secretory pathway predicted ATPase ExeA
LVRGVLVSPTRHSGRRFLYLSAKHAEALAHLRLGLTEPGGFVCITGEIGTGKTTVLRTFLADLGPDVSTAFIFNPTLSWDDLLQRIARELGVPITGASHVDAMDALNAHLLAQRKEGRISVAVIDEARLHGRLRLLEPGDDHKSSSARARNSRTARLLLLDPSLAQPNQAHHAAHLRRRRGPRLPTYVRHRLGVAGGADATPLFTTPALYLVHRYSGGVPRLVNMIAHRATLAAYVRRRRRIGARDVRAAYREIRAVPLTTAPVGRRLGWVMGAVVAGVAVGLASIGMPRFEWKLPRRAERRRRQDARGRGDHVAGRGAAAAAGTACAGRERTGARPAGRERAPAAPTPTSSCLAARERARPSIDTVLRSWRVQNPPRRGGDPDTVQEQAHGGASKASPDRQPEHAASICPPCSRSARDARVVVRRAEQHDDEVAERMPRPSASPARPHGFDAQVARRDFRWSGPFGTEAKGAHTRAQQRLLTRAASTTVRRAGFSPGRPRRVGSAVAPARSRLSQAAWRIGVYRPGSAAFAVSGRPRSAEATARRGRKSSIPALRELEGERPPAARRGSHRKAAGAAGKPRARSSP